ncbi:hypothetical protein Taro_033871 [Colocasia esculenta]|uniref:Uncharacterized protein n=1 Tax=Colocasia esculenta TaxID=4460 RepID=A0A843VPV5_COLES|nr:hypothetical protein [Colocasia esculenta]
MSQSQTEPDTNAVGTTSRQSPYRDPEDGAQGGRGLFEYFAYLTGLNSNPSRSSDLWVAARPSGVPGGGPGGRVVTVVVSFPAGSECELQESVVAVAGCAL